jgi:hypothetical protein
MTESEWNEYKAKRAERLSRLHRRREEGALAELFALYARQYHARAKEALALSPSATS